MHPFSRIEVESITNLKHSNKFIENQLILISKAKLFVVELEFEWLTIVNSWAYIKHLCVFFFFFFK